MTGGFNFETMTSGIRTTHINPDGSKGSTFYHIPSYIWGRWGGRIVRMKEGRREPACRIVYRDGSETITFESDYDHIEPLKPGPKDVFL